jgi:anti-sigma regulatory factor (Ser/Thr protein kinase)
VAEPFRLQLTSSPGAVPALNDAFTAFAAAHGLSTRTRCAVNLALEEVVTNVITHGYRGEEGRPILIEVAVPAEELVASVEDQGPPFDPLLAPEPDVSLPPDQRSHGGVGLLLVRKLMDRLEYTRTNGTNRLVIHKRL